jgi:hypothetical protein
VYLLAYETVKGNLLCQYEHASSITPTSTDNNGEMYVLFPEYFAAEAVLSGAMMVVTLSSPTEDDVLDFSFLARSGSIFVYIHEVPRARNTFGHVVSYSAGTAAQPFPAGTQVRDHNRIRHRQTAVKLTNSHNSFSC